MQQLACQQREPRLPIDFLDKLLDLAEVHAPCLAVLYAHGHLAFCDTGLAHVARLGEHGDEGPLPFAVLLALPGPYFFDLDAELAFGQLKILLACDLAAVAPRAILVIDQNSFNHSFNSSSFQAIAQRYSLWI